MISYNQLPGMPSHDLPSGSSLTNRPVICLIFTGETEILFPAYIDVRTIESCDIFR
jgi:hypothetical protein